MLQRLTALYSRVLGWCLRNRWTTFALVSVLFVSVMALGSRLPTEFFPKNDRSLIMMRLKLPVGSSLEETDRAFRRAEAIVERHVPERAALNVDIGVGEGFVALFAEGPHAGILRLKLKGRDERTRSQAEIEEDLRRRFSRIPGVDATVMDQNLFGNEGDITVQLFGHDIVEARRLGMEVKDLVEKLEGTADVTFSLEAGKPEYEVVLDRKRLSALGLTTAAVSSAVSAVFAGQLASVYREGGYEYDIRVRGPRSYRQDARDLEGLLVPTPSGEAVPLSAIAEVRPAVGPATINRKYQQRLVTVSCAVTSGDLGGTLDKLTKKLESFPMPEGFTYRIGGAAEDFQESFLWLAVALVASILLVYMVMASQFESLLHPFLILFTIPLSGVGVVAALGLTGTSLSVVALIGVLVLAGVVVNNAIVLIDTINQYRDKGIELFEAVMEAGRRRMRPILMTAATTTLGMLPLALEIGDGSESWSPMARSVIGGLTVSTLLTLIVIPTLYMALEAFRLRRRERREARRAGTA
jgi:HAE1 family hydrophobic/amphiphilic exporter-1